MSRSQLVFAAADGVSGAGPDCVEDSATLCARVYDWLGLDWLDALDQVTERFVAEGFRTPLPLLTSASGAGVR
jgi:hypothetical protein